MHPEPTPVRTFLVPVYILSLSSESLGTTILGENEIDYILHHVSAIKLSTTY